jgi:hypothetical protein
MRIWERAWRMQVGDLDLSSLACRFKATRSLYGYAGTLDLEVRNLNEEHRRAIVRAPRYRTFVEVQAGYREGMSLIFRGDLRKAMPSREGTDWVVKITAGDGEHALRTARVARSFASGTTLQTVVQAIAEAMGVGPGNAAQALRGARLGGLDDTFPEGTMLFGGAAAELTRLTASAGLTWSIQDGNLQVLPRGGALAREAILLSASTGLIGVPEVVTRRALKLKAALIPGLVPGQLVMVESDVVALGTRGAAGAWRISQAEYAGDTHGQDWAATLTVHRPAPPLLSSTTTHETGVQ